MLALSREVAPGRTGVGTVPAEELARLACSGEGQVCHYMMQPLVELYGGCMVVLKM